MGVYAPPPAYAVPADEQATAALARLGIAPVVPGRLGYEQACALAMVRSTTALLARATAARTAADARVAAERANPVFNLSPDRVLEAVTGGSPYTVAVTLAVALFRPREGAARRGIRDAAAEAANFDAATAVWRARAAAAAAYRDTVAARTALGIAREADVAAAERLASADRLRAAGYAGGVDHDLLVQLRGRARGEVSLREGAVARAEATLAAAIGAPGRSLAGVALDADVMEAPPGALPAAAAATTRALGNRMDIQATLARFRGAVSTARIARVTRNGVWSAGPAYTFDKGQNRLGFTLNGEIPLYHTGRARTAAAAAALAEARAGVEAAQAAAVAGVAAAETDIAARRDEAARAAATVADLSREEARAQRLFAAGEGDRPTLIDARSRRLAGELALADARARGATALSALEDALQASVWPASPGVVR